MIEDYGGEWTIDKLNRLRKYLKAYMTIFSANEKAKFLTPIYVDAFAGSGYRLQDNKKQKGSFLFPEIMKPDAKGFLKGSARIALEITPPFKQFIFIEQDPLKVKELENLRKEFPQKTGIIKIIETEANAFLKKWCTETDWRTNRAVVFLDPYGMEVEWSLIESLAATKAVDLWLLFPLGIAVNRLLKKNSPPNPEWERALTRIFGTSDWKDAFYSRRKKMTLFGEEEVFEKDTDFYRIAQFFVNRLKTVYPGVAKNPLPLRNSKNIPLYLLCFAVANPRAVGPALKIAQDILLRKK
jgi:three-Cys-motif partner protein